MAVECFLVFNQKKRVKLAYFITQLHYKLFTIHLHSNITTHLHYAPDFYSLIP